MPSAPSKPAARELRTLSVLAAIQFTHIVDFMIMMPLGSQLMRVFAISPSQFSHLVAAYGVAAAISGLVGGFFMDRFDRKHALLGLYFGFCLATLACALAPNFFALLLARLLAGAFGGLAGSVVVAMVGDVVPPERRGRGMGVVMTAFPLASVLGVPLGLWLAGMFEWHAPFFFLVAVILVVLAVGLKTLPSIHSPNRGEDPWKQMRAIVSHPVHQRGLLMSAVLVFAGSCVIPFMAPSLVANVGVAENHLQWVYFAGGVATLVSTPFIGRMSDRHDKLHVLGWVSLLAVFATLAITNLPPMAGAQWRYTAITASAVVTALFMVTMSGRFSPAMSMLTNAVDGRYRGGFMSVNSAVQQASSGLAIFFAGLVVTKSDSGHLVGFPRLGIVAVGCFALTLFLAARLRKLAPHAARRPVVLPPVAPVAPVDT